TTVSDTLPAGTTLVANSAPGDFTCTPAGADISCAGSLTAGARAVFTVVAFVGLDQTGTTLTNAATITSTAAADPVPDPTPDAAGFATTVGPATTDLTISKRASANTIPAGAYLSYTIGVANTGPSAVTSTVVSDSIPVGTTYRGVA